jgi:hypothetical protein
MSRWLAVNQVSRPTSMSIDLSLLPAASATIRLAGAAAPCSGRRILGERPEIVTKPPYDFVAS